MMQKAMLVRWNAHRAYGLDELNIALNRGWRVAQVTPMGGAAVGSPEEGSELCLAALVVIERHDQAESSVLHEVEEELDELVEGDGSELDVGDLDVEDLGPPEP